MVTDEGDCCDDVLLGGKRIGVEFPAASDGGIY